MKPKILAFVDQYLIDLNARQAAIRAGYAESNANQTGMRLLKKPDVKALIGERMKARAERTEIDQDRVLKEIARVAFSDIRKTMTWGPDGVKLIESSELTDDQAAGVAEVAETTSTNGGSLKLRKHDKMKALELLGRHLGLFVDKVEHTGKDGGPIETRNVGELTDDELLHIATGGSTGTADKKTRAH